VRRPETPARPQSARLTCPKCGAWVETYLPVCSARCLRCNRDFVPAGGQDVGSPAAGRERTETPVLAAPGAPCGALAGRDETHRVRHRHAAGRHRR
jgi:hypothetical protein